MAALTRQIIFRAARRFLQGVACVFCILLFTYSTPAPAQFLDQGGITGTVKDTSGAAIPGAQVILVDPATGLKLTGKTDGSGVYVFSPIKIGTYSVTASAPGFKQTSQQNIAVNIGARTTVSITLEPGAVSQTVTVTGAPPLLQSQDSSVGQTLTSQQINDTPLNSRNPVYLAQLTAGTAPSTTTRAAGNGDFSANGLRPEQNNFVLDGVDNNAVTVDYLNVSSYLVNPPPDALEEFKVSTADYSAEYGHSAGAVINASVKSGTNQIHGDLWEYWRNDVLDAHDWVLAPSTPNSEYRENQFGATLGLPILKNHLFFFGDVQANRIAVDTPQAPITVPTALERQGNFTELLTPSNFGASKPTILYEPHNNQTKQIYNGQQNVLNPNQIVALPQKILNMYPMPNTTVNGVASNNYNYSLKQPQDTFQWDTRVDWNVSATDQAFVRFSYVNEKSNREAPLGPVLDGGGGAGALNQSGAQTDFANNFVLSETHIFNPRIVNEFRFAFDYGHFDYLNPGNNTNDAAALGIGGVPFGPDFPDNGGLPTTTISGGGGIFGFGAHAFRPEQEKENEYQILDNLSWTLGNHSLRLGFSDQQVRSYTLEPPASHPEYTYNGALTGEPSVSNTGSGVADFLTDNQDSGSIGPSTPFNNQFADIAGYVEDDWKTTSKLTLNLGVRYDFFLPYKEMANRQANFNVNSVGISTGSGVYLLPAADQGKLTLNPKFLQELAANNINLQYYDNPRLTKYQHLNFAPRVGFAYSPTQRTVLRGGYGIFYQGQQQIGAADNMGTNYPFVFTDNFVNPGCVTGQTNCPTDGYNFETGFSSAIAQGLTTFFSTPTLIGQSTNLKTTYAMDYNLAVEQAITNNFVATIGYVGTASRHLPLGINGNAPAVLLPSGSNQTYLPFPGFSSSSNILYEGISEYNGLQTKLQKRISHGLSFLATYTWSHAVDDALDPLSGGNYRDVNIIPIRQDLTNSGWDTRHRFTFNGFYALPFGRGRTYMAHDSALEDAFLGGWSTNVTYQLQSGNPFTVSTANQTNAVGGNANPIMVRDPFAPGGTPDPTNPNEPCATSTRNKQFWFNPCAFRNPLPSSEITPLKLCPNPMVACQPAKYPYPTYVTGEQAALAFLGGRSATVYGPGYQRMDMSLFKNFTTFREQYLQLRVDAFNVLNTPAYGQPNGSIGNTKAQITGARQVQLYTPDSRFFQLSAKYVF